MRAAPQTATEKALEELDRLYRRYRAAKEAEFKRLCADPVWGDRLREFGATLNHFGADDADRMIDYVAREASWLRHEAPDDIRFAALQLVSARIVRIRVRQGLAPFDDPLMGDEPDVWQLCKKAISP